MTQLWFGNMADWICIIIFENDLDIHKFKTSVILINSHSLNTSTAEQIIKCLSHLIIRSSIFWHNLVACFVQIQKQQV